MPGADSGPEPNPNIPLARYILVDQFGYRPSSTKIAVLADPVKGSNSADSYTAASSYEVRRATDNTSVGTFTPTQFKNGNTDPTSGDRGWWLDFSSVTTPGYYYIYDGSQNLRSDVFKIDDDVYKPILKAAVRMFFYNRAGIDKPASAAGSCWADTASYLGPGQDTEARSVHAKNDASTARDLRGGWYDAGDTNKYVTFAARPVHELLASYRSAPHLWTDDFEIPESGNGIPDILDEVRWELDWLLRMQQANGGVLIKMGVDTYNNPAVPLSADKRPRYYQPICSSSTIAAASMFAHGAYVMKNFPALAGYTDTLTQAAEAAWTHYSGSSRDTDCARGELTAGDPDWELDEQDVHALIAAIYLFAVTGKTTYNSYVTTNYKTNWSTPHSMMYHLHAVEALLTYTELPNRTTNTANSMKSTLHVDNDFLGTFPGRLPDELYRAAMPDWSYHWGSLQVRGRAGAANSIAATYSLGGSASALRTRAEDHVHYFHGVNPLGLVYLTNMKSYGAVRSLNRLWHMWFRPGTQWDNAATGCGPAPGFTTGGPNAQHTSSSVANNPLQKIFVDVNDDSAAGWELNEPGIYYQSAYVRALTEAAK